MSKVKTRKYMAGVLALVMLLGMLPMNALAFIFKVDTSPAVNLGESLPLRVSPPVPTHTYKFMVDGVLKDTQIIKNGGILTEPAVPLEEGRKFTGWSGQDGGGNPVEIKFGQPITVEGTKIITATAQFVPVVYVSFVLVEGEEGEEGYSEQVIYTKEATPPDWTVDANGVPLHITEDGKVFSHWSATKKGPPFDFDTPINQDTTLYTVTKDAWTVTFDSNGGSAVLPKIVEGGQQIGDLPESERPGYTFKHWSLDGTNPIASNYIVTSNLTLHAVWEPGANTPYKVVYWLQNAEDNDNVYTFEEIVYKTGTTNGPAAYDSKSYTGFHFGSAENKTISGNGDTVVNVKYDRNVYTFTIERRYQNSNSWTTVSTTQLKYGQSTATPYNAAVAAYPYYSWYISRTSNTAYSEAPAMPNENLTVHGRYSGSAYQYTIGYYEKGTNTQIKEPYSFYSGTSRLRFTIEDGINIPGFTVTPMDQWDTLSPGQVSKIYYTRNTYDLTFNKNNGNAPLVVSNIPFDSDISNKDTTGFNENTTYEEAGITYYFSGWYDNSACEGTPYSLAGKKMPAHNLALYAKWTPETYTVTFYNTLDPEDGSYAEQPGIVPLHTATIPGGHPPGGTDFLGWYWYIGTSFVKFDFDTPVSGDFKLYPLFRSQTAKVLYNENFGDNPQTKEDPRLYLIGAKAKVMSPTGFIDAPSDKVFVGWNTKADGTGTTYQPNGLVTVPSGNITLYAQWASPAPTISLTYNGNGGTLPPDEHETIVYYFLNNETHVVIANPFIRTGYNFTGWNTKADGTGASYAVGTEVLVDNDGDNTLYAQWIKQAKATITGTKTVKGRTGTFNDTFNFTLESITAGAPMPAAVEGAAASATVDANDTPKNFSFEEITFEFAHLNGKQTETYEYVVKETTPALYYTASNDVTVTVTLTNLGNGTLGVTVNPVAAFTNTYKANDSDPVTITGKKTLTGKTLVADQFSFELSGGKLSTPKTSKNDADGNFSFSPIVFEMADLGGKESEVFTFQVKEVVPESNPSGGITYDTSIYNVAVSVRDNKAGSIVIDSIVYTVGGVVAEKAEFSNTYSAQPTSGLTLKGQKTLTGRPAALSAAEFSFVLSGDASEEVKNVADGGFSFTALTYTAAGTYNYVIKEKTPSNVAGVTDDTTEYAVVVTVIDNSQGQLLVSKVTVNGTEVTVDNGVVSGFNFTNEYEAEETSGLTLKGQKTLTGRPAALSAAEFSFVLSGDALEEVKNVADGGFSFTALTYTAAGTYNYVIKEKTPSNVAGVTDDTTEYAVVVTVIDNSQGQLLVSKVTVNGTEVTVDNGVVSGFNFTNEYEAEETSGLTLKGQKTLTGRPAALSAAEFSFVLSGDASEEVKNVADGGFSFTALTYTAAGTYNYVIKEKTPSNVAGVTDDTTEYAVVVTVIDNSQGQLLVSKVTVNGTEVTVDNGVVSGFNFTNEYEAEETSGLTLKGQKTLTGRPAALSAAEFSFVLSGDASEEVKNVADGGFSFTALTYTAAGTYNYVIKEKTPSNVAGVTDDTTEYAVVVTVIDNSQGQLLVSKVTVNGTEVTVDNGVVSGFNFTNEYEAEETSGLTLKGQKTLTGRPAALSAAEFSFVLSGDASEEVKNVADGGFSFTALTYTAAGTYNYVIKEKTPSNVAGVTDDTTEYAVVVTVIDNSQGQLLVSKVTVNGTEATVDNGVVSGFNFTNEYEAEETSGLTLKGQKTLTGRPAALSAAEFSFVLSGDASEEVKNVADGGFSFTALTYTAAGTYNYVIKEKTPSNVAGVTDDTTEYAVVVTVIDNSQGQLLVSKVTVNGTEATVDNGVVSGFNFTNEYEAEETSGLTLKGQKTLTGRPAALSAAEFSFVLSGDASEEVKNVADGGFSFTALTYTAAGTYNYVIKEKTPSNVAGVTDDTTEYAVVVTVIDNSQGQLLVSKVTVNGTEATVDNGVVSGFNFTNEYEAEETSGLTLKGQKTLTGRPAALSAAEFSFVLSGDASEEVKNVADGGFSFTALTYTAAGTYNYVIKEKTPSNVAGVTDDTTEYAVVVTVIDNSQGQLLVSKVTVNGTEVTVDNGVVSGFNFTNTYAASGKLTLSGTKTFTGRDATAADVFEFKLYKDTVADGNLIDTQTVTGSGTYSFAVLNYYLNLQATPALNDLGNHTYVVVETVPVSNPSGGITYDTTEHTVVVTVDDAGDGKLNITATGVNVSGSAGVFEGTGLNFTNTYAASGKLTLSGTKTFTGRDATAADVFEFKLYKDTVADGNLIDTQTVTGSGTYSFAVLNYYLNLQATPALNDLGNHTYVVVETVPVSNPSGGITYDTTQYTVVVTVSDAGDGKLNITATGANVSGSAGVFEGTGLNFTNTYAASGKLTLSGTKTFTGRAATAADVFEFKLYKDEVADGNLIDTQTVTGSGTYSFAALNYYLNLQATPALNDLGEHKYVVVETVPVSNPSGGVTYDTTQYTVVVTVSDAGDGKLNITATGANVSGSAGVFEGTGLNFTNIYEANGEFDVDAEIGVTKKLEAGGRELTAGEFSFTLSSADDADNATLSGTNDLNGDVSFANLVYDEADIGKTYTYKVVENIPDPQEIGMTYSANVLTFKVTVTDSGNGELEATKSEVTGSSEFVNAYEAGGEFDVDAEIGVTKKLEAGGRELTAGEFSFTLSSADDADNATLSGTNDLNGDVSFANLVYDEADIGKTYTYKVVENIPDPQEIGMTYSANVLTFKVTVTDTGGGVLKATKSEVTGSSEFVNAYEAGGEFDVDAEIGVTKKLEAGGRELTAGEFSFTLSSADDADNATLSGTNDLNGDVSFANLVYDEADIGKTYTYTVVENIPDPQESGMTYSANVLTFKVTVTDTGGGVLKATKSEVTGSSEFVNAYEAGGEFDVDAEIGVTKKLEAGGRELTAGEFSFTLSSADDADNATLSGTNDLNGDVSFANLVYDQADIGKTYTYKVVENIPDPQESGMTYSANVLTFKVTVTDSGGGVLKATKSEVTGSSEFVNAYEAGGEFDVDAEIGVTKKLEAGGRELTAGEFSFTLSSADDADNAALSGTNDLNGDVSFANLVYDEADIGKTYTYKVIENIPDPQEIGMTYSTNVLTFKVTVTDSGNGELEATKSEVTGSSEFVNAYEAGGEFDVDAEIGVTKKLEAGGRALTAGEFSFTLSSADDADNATLSGTNDLNGDVSFANLVYDEADIGKTYTYKVVENIPDPQESGMTYSTNVLTFKVTVTDTGGGVLKATKSEVTGSSEFVNAYEAGGEFDVDAEIGVTKKLEAGGRELTAGEFSFTLSSADDADNTAQTVSNAANGKVSFTKLLYDEADIGKTYTYTVVENIPDPQESGMTYSANVLTFKVTVTDSGNGVLKATKSEVTGSSEFVNVYEAGGEFDVDAEIGVTKKLEAGGRALTAGEFSFTLSSADDADNTAQTVSNAANGKVSFAKLLYEEADIGKTYTYKVVENIPDPQESGMTYSANVLTFKVTVTDTGGGVLEATKSEVTGSSEFVNAYEADGELDIETFINPTKSLTGRALTAGEFTFELRQDDTLLQRVTNDAEGNILFSPLGFTEEDIGQTYSYTIVEIPGTEANMTYSTMEINFSVLVGNAGNGELSLKVNAPTDVIFFNVYTAPAPDPTPVPPIPNFDLGVVPSNVADCLE